MKISIEQTKPLLGNVSKNLETIITKIDTAIKNKVDLIIFPELSLTGYHLEDLTYEVSIKDIPESLLKKSEDISIVFGAVELGEDFFTYNTAYYLEDGKLIHKHRKVFLQNYGQFSESRYFNEGEDISSFDTKYGKFGLLLSGDTTHPLSHYTLAKDSAKVIINLVNFPTALPITNEFSNKKETFSSKIESIFIASSFCNGIYNIVVNRVGVEDGTNFYGSSFVVEPNGSISHSLPLFQEGSLICDITDSNVLKARKLFPNLK